MAVIYAFYSTPKQAHSFTYNSSLPLSFLDTEAVCTAVKGMDSGAWGTDLGLYPGSATC